MWRAAEGAAAAAVPAAANPPATNEPDKLPELVLKGIGEFNRGEFFECHESLEDAWRDEPRRVRFLYQGILQVGVGFYHQRNGKGRGAVAVMRRGIEHLRGFEPETLGIDVSKLVRKSERCLRELEVLGYDRVREFDPAGIPKVEFTG